MQVSGIDHIVLVSDDVERSLRFYCDELGMDPVRVEPWRRGEAPFPSVRVSPETIIDIVAGERSGENVNHFALVVESVDLDAVASEGGFDVVAGPSDLFGARGQGRGLYVRDPDGNVVELRTYPDR